MPLSCVPLLNDSLQKRKCYSYHVPFKCRAFKYHVLLSLKFILLSHILCDELYQHLSSFDAGIAKS